MLRNRCKRCIISYALGGVERRICINGTFWSIILLQWNFLTLRRLDRAQNRLERNKMTIMGREVKLSCKRMYHLHQDTKSTALGQRANNERGRDLFEALIITATISFKPLAMRVCFYYIDDFSGDRLQ